MKICITARGPTLKSAFERHFARAPWFILYDTRTGKSEAIRNGFVLSDVRIGRNTVQLLKMNDIEAVITGEIGDNARDLLKGAEIRLHRYEVTGMVKDAIDTVLLRPVT
jgi:predicted Fe-Mo cluster-binding NifX family protein